MEKDRQICVSYQEFLREYFVPSEFVYQEPSNSYGGWGPGIAYMNGKRLQQATDRALSRGTFDRWGGNAYAYDDKLSALLGDTIGNALAAGQQPERLVLRNVRVIRMQPNVGGFGYDAHIAFTLEDREHWGVFRRIGIDKQPTLTSEVDKTFKDEVVKRKVHGMLRRTLLDWLTPKTGQYKQLADAVRAVTEDGRLTVLRKGERVVVLQSYPERYEAKVEAKGRRYTVAGEAYLLFNYWFQLTKP